MKRKSENEKKFAGTFRNDRANKVERQPEMNTIPDPPDALSTRAAGIYYQTAYFLNKQGLLNDVRARQVGIYAHEVAAYLNAAEKLEQMDEVKEVYAKDGTFRHYQLNPLTKVAAMHQRAALSWGRQLLILPGDADKLPSPINTEDNPFNIL